MAIRTDEQALKAIQSDAAGKALSYIERETPRSLEAIVFFVNGGQSVDEIMEKFRSAYDITEPKVLHKFQLVIEMLIRERDMGEF